MSKINDVQRWRAEITIAEKFREEEFGKYTRNEKLKAGENIEYFEKGFFESSSDDSMVTTVNIIDAIVSIIVPSLYFKNPRTIAIPLKIESEGTAPLAGKTVDSFRKRLSTEEINQKVIWDTYVLGYGVTKTGYVTKFGKDIEDDSKDRSPKSLVDKGLEMVGLKKKEEEEVIRPEIDQRIVAESPFIEYISPFDFLMDPRAKSLDDAMWWGHSIRKTVAGMKRNKKYKNTSSLKGIDPDLDTFTFQEIPSSQIEEFQTVDLYEIHYRDDTDFYILVISKDGNDEWKEHYHEKSIYELGEWQADMLTFKKHNHKQFPRSDISKIKPLQDRITSTIDAILEQVDRFQAKIAYEDGGLTPNGKRNLLEGGLGALVECTKDPNNVFKELNFTQLKADLKALIDQIISLITIQTGLTRAQLTGVSSSGSATEATIEQGGQNIRLSDMQQAVQKFANRQSRKLFKVCKQFVSFDELQLINGSKGIDPETGIPKYEWLTVSPEENDRLTEGDYDFDIEVGSTQKIDLAVVRKAFENLFSLLARTEVLAIIQAQGHDVKLAEVLKKHFDLFPELGMDSSKIIQKIDQPTLPLPGQENRGGMTTGSQHNQVEAQRAEPTPTIGREINKVF